MNAQQLYSYSVSIFYYEQWSRNIHYILTNYVIFCQISFTLVYCMIYIRHLLRTNVSHHNNIIAAECKSQQGTQHKWHFSESSGATRVCCCWPPWLDYYSYTTQEYTTTYARLPTKYIGRDHIYVLCFGCTLAACCGLHNNLYEIYLFEILYL